MEKIKNIIENKIDNSKRFENVQEELLDYQFQYIEKLDKKYIELTEENTNFDETNSYYVFLKNFKENLSSTFSKNMFEYTTLFRLLEDDYIKRVSKKDFKEDVFHTWAQNIFNEIGNIYNSRDVKWKDDVFTLIKEKLNGIGPEIEDKENDEKEKNFGLIHFNVIQEKKIVKFGLNSYDHFMNIHLSDLYKQREDNKEVVNLFSGNTWSKLACEIVDNHSEIKAIIARSWLIDSPKLRERIGFIKYDENRNLRNGAFWGQFINDKGEINQERIDRFLETGQPEYFVSMGFIKTEDFLEKYLPNKKKNLVKLKYRTEESLNFEKEKEKITKEIEARFDELSYEDIYKLIMNSVLVDFFKTALGVEFLGFLDTAKEKKLKKIDGINDERFSELKKEFRKFVEERENQYVEREVTIK